MALRLSWQPRLLIFDNCEELELLERWRPKRGGCRVLVTSRNTIWPDELDANQQPIFTEAKVPIVWATRNGASHLEVLGDGKSFRGPMTAWFRYKRMGDATAGAYFQKSPCTLCTQAGWSVQHNSRWQ